MKKRLFLNFLIAVMLVTMLAPAAYAMGPSDSGSCGDNLTWTLEDYTLTISGEGEMAEDFGWAEYQDKIEHVVLTGGVTSVAANAFCEYERLETVDFGDALVQIGAKAFYGCTDIEYIHLPKTFRRFESQCFRGCTSLKFVYCDGGMPSFRDSCLWTGNYIAVFYPTNNPWSSEYTAPLISSYGGNLGIMMGNFDESTVAAALAEYEDDEEEETEATEETVVETTEETVEATEAVTEAATEPAVVLVTEPVTVPTTEPETEPVETTVPETEETTVPTTEAVETTEWVLFEDETVEEETVAEKVGGNGWIGMVLIAGVLTFLIVGALIFRSVSCRNRRY